MKGRINLIKLTGLNNKEVILNAEHIEKLEAVPESLVTLTNGNKYIVLESTDEIINRVIEYKNKIFRLGL
jgi:flagellar protein FlbD